MSRDVLQRDYIITMPWGDSYAIPVMAIAMNRAKYYAKEFGGDVEKSLREDTEPLFQDSNMEIADWAQNNMNFSDVKDVAVLLPRDEAIARDLEDGWCNGDWEIRNKNV